MKYKDFVRGCNQRACDGNWSIGTMKLCVEVMARVNVMPFWRREKEWQRLNKLHKIEHLTILKEN